MKPSTELKILQLCKGMTIKRAERRLDLMATYQAQKQTTLRIKLSGLNIGD